MIWHQQIITYQPGFRLRPSFVKQTMRGFVGQPRIALLGGYGEQDKVESSEVNVNAG